jgi:hypothetical protein
MPRTYRYLEDRNAARRLKRGLTGVPDNYLLCRDLLHAWDVVSDFHITDHNSIERTLQCSRCSTIRYDSFSTSQDGLVKDRSRYSYPQDYQLKNVPRGVKPGVFVRGELFKRSGGGKTRAFKVVS